MPNVWTHGVWRVKPGREDDFVEVWREMAREGMAELDTVEPPTLLRDRERPGEFISFGPWPNVDEVERFRSSSVFHRGQERMRELLESFTPRTLDEVSRGG
jgi:heme-degrading monooxygenase HmoA